MKKQRYIDWFSISPQDLIKNGRSFFTLIDDEAKRYGGLLDYRIINIETTQGSDGNYYKVWLDITYKI